MNPFDIINNTTELNISNDNYTIEIWIESKGRKCNTFVSGWNIANTDLDAHLKIIKKKNACGGSIETSENGNKILKLQGDHVNYIKKYLKEHNIMEESIKVKGNN